MSIEALKRKFHVISVVSNPIRFQSRKELYRQFVKELEMAGVNHQTVEVAFGDRPFELTTADDPRALRLRSFEELWHKENMINLAIQRLPSDWEYVAWIDADVAFARRDWVDETVHQLQHHMVVQLFRDAVDLGPDHQAIQTHKGFVWSYLNSNQPPKPYYTDWHPGYAWAARREAIDALGGLIDKSILGAGDRHMALSLIGKGNQTVETRMHPEYHDMIRTWEERAERFIRRDIGFVDGTLLHYWHGKKIDRRYHDRWKILVDFQYRPYHDLKRDWQGLYQLNDDGTIRCIKFRDTMRWYYRARNEDSIDL